MGAPRAFTLVEIVVAGVILALVAAATTAAISSTIRSRDRAAARAEAHARAHAAANRLAADLENALRDADLFDCRIALTPGTLGGRPADGLLLLTNITRPVRPGEPEGREAEVQYRLEAGPTGQAGATLWRRVDPGIDDYPDAGGVASALVDGVLSLSLGATEDGSVWIDAWDSDADGLPHAVRLTVTATDQTGLATASTRRLVAFDRVAPPIAEEEDEESDDAGADDGGGQ